MKLFLIKIQNIGIENPTHLLTYRKEIYSLTLINLLSTVQKEKKINQTKLDKK